MSLLHPHSKRFIYPTASLEEQRLRRILIGAILEFGEPHDFESGAMTRPLTQDKNGGYMPTPQPNNPQKALEYYMLQEEGDGYAIFGALRTTYEKRTVVEPVRLAVQFVTVRGTAVIDVSIPSRYAADEQERERSYEEKVGAQIYIGLVSKVKGAKLEEIMLAVSANKNIPTEDFKPLLQLIREQGETKKRVALKPEYLELLAAFIERHFGDYAHLVPEEVPKLPGEIIPETPAEVSASHGWVAGVAHAVEEVRRYDHEHPNQNDPNGLNQAGQGSSTGQTTQK